MSHGIQSLHGISAASLVTRIRPPELMHKPRAAEFDVLLPKGTRANPNGPLLPQRSKRMNSLLAERVTSRLVGMAKRCRTSSPVFCVPLLLASTNTNQPQSQLEVPEANAQPLVPVASLRRTILPPRLMASERAKYRADCRLSVALRIRQRSTIGVKLGAASAASYQKEAPRLCRGGSRSLTFQEVVHRRDFQS